MAVSRYALATFGLIAALGFALPAAAEDPAPPGQPQSVPASPSMSGPQLGFLATADVNGDGAVDSAEFEQLNLARFKAADADNDGFVTSDEMRAQIKRWNLDMAHPAPTPASEANAASPPPPPSGMASMMPQPMPAPAGGQSVASPVQPMPPKVQASARFIERVDTDHDGKISVSETMAASARMFTWLDRDRDGKLAGAELAPPFHRDGSSAPAAKNAVMPAPMPMPQPMPQTP
jgi:hypothetical protein